MSNEVEELRMRARWYRDFARLSTADERVWRFQMADCFERIAETLEQRARAHE